jgi:thioredoxin
MAKWAQVQTQALGSIACCETLSMNYKPFILLGPPGVGVQAQAIALAERWQVPQVSVGQLIREAIAQRTEIGLEARAFVKAGDLVADDLVMQLIRRWFEQPDVMLKGWILTGFPRRLTQAQAFGQWVKTLGLPPVKVVYLKVMAGLLINRLLTEAGPGQSIVTVRQRIAAHEQEVAPLLAYYQQQEQLTTLNASLSFTEVTSALYRLGHPKIESTRLIEDEAELDTLLAQESVLVVDCMASWCGPCRVVTPLIDRLAQAYGDRAKIMKMDFDVNRQIPTRFALKGMPAVMFFKQGQLLETLIGVKSYETYCATVDWLLEDR